MNKEVVLIGHYAVETDSVLTAAKVASRALKNPKSEGHCMVDGKRYKWYRLYRWEQISNDNL